MGLSGREGSMTTMATSTASSTRSFTRLPAAVDPRMSYPDSQPAVEGLMAADYEVSEDFTTYTFQLKDATFHNGDTVTASDFVYAFERLTASSNSSRAYAALDPLGVTPRRRPRRSTARNRKCTARDARRRGYRRNDARVRWNHRW